VKIYQAFYADEHKREMFDTLIPLDTRGLKIPLLEYDIFRHLRDQGDFGVVSWKFCRKTWLEEWEEEAREHLKTWDAVVINPFPGVQALSYNCWDSHPKLKNWANVDTNIPMWEMAFCSYILAKKPWWDKYFDFIDNQLKNLHSDATKEVGYWRNRELSAVPFLIERWLNYTLEGAYLWRYPREHYELKFGNDELYNLQQIKYTPQWYERRKQINFLDIGKKDDIG